MNEPPDVHITTMAKFVAKDIFDQAVFLCVPVTLAYAITPNGDDVFTLVLTPTSPRSSDRLADHLAVRAKLGYPFTIDAVSEQIDNGGIIQP